MARAIGLAGAVTRLVVEAEMEPRVTACHLARRAMRTARTILHVHGVDVVARGPEPRGACVIVANHLSYIDPLVVAAVTPCVAIAKGETRGWPLIGRGLAALGVIFVQRGDPYSGATALRAAHRAVREGATVLNFPEGTTSDGRDVGPFRRGIFGLAFLAGVPVVPARVSYDDERVPWFGGQTFAPHYWRLAGAERVGARVSFGAAIQPRAHERADDLARRARDAITEL
ncbi:MAG TPA: lysophospholipid acyltransferase family protein [Polyangiaceae bacterium]